MAAKLGFELVKQAMLKLLMKKGDDGIVLTLPKNEIVDYNAKITMDRLIRNGIDPDSLTSPDQVINVLDNINNQIMNKARVIPSTSAEGKAITEKLFGKRGEVISFKDKIEAMKKSGDIVDPDNLKVSEKVTEREMFKNSNLNKKDSVTETVSYIKTLEPMDAMKEANSVIGRKGKYKNLTPEESQRILKETDDHIFERDIPIDPEDMAKGGRAGFANGNGVDDELVIVEAYGPEGRKLEKTTRSHAIKYGLTIVDDETKDSGRAGHYTGGIVDVEPSLDDIGHGSDALMARTRLVSPGNQATTSTGLNYLLAEDNDNMRVPFGSGGSYDYGSMQYKIDSVMAAYKRYKKGSQTSGRGGKMTFEQFAPIWAKENFATGGRAGFSAGGMGRRAFLKLLASIGGGVAAAKSGILSLGGKGATKQVAKELTSVPIGNPEGMPAWFKPLVNKIIKEGDDVTKKFGTVDREIVHTKKIDKFEEVTVYQDLNTGNVRLEYGPHLTDNTGKVIRASNEPTVVHLEYKAPEVLEPNLTTGKSGGKTKEEFYAAESEPEIVNWEGDIEMSGINEVNKVDDLITDTSKLQKYATDNKLTIKELSDSMKKQKYKNKLDSDLGEQVNYIENKQGMNAMDYIDEGTRVGDFDSKGYQNYDTKGMNLPEKKADGGRIGLFMGGGLTAGKGLLKNMLKFMSKDGSHKKSPAEILKMMNPKQYEKLLNNPKYQGQVSSEAPEGLDKIIQDMIGKTKTERSDMVGDIISTSRNIKKVDDDILNYKLKIIEDMVSKGIDREIAEEAAENISKEVAKSAGKKSTPKITEQGLLELENLQKNLLTKDRKLQAQGGLTTMLGE